jgi:hemerythrin-like domain-containing protein
LGLFTNASKITLERRDLIMLPIGPLMIEHRLIERMIKVMKSHVRQIEKEGTADPLFIDKAVDFIRTYADRCHHGKEEDILFRDLKTKDIAQEHKRVMEELLEEHRKGRKVTGQLVEAKEKYVQGNQEALGDIVECLKTLVDFYPKHIEKEDRHFFLPIMNYFSKEEKDAMLKEGYEFDQRLIHERYQNIVAHYEKAAL